MKLTAFAICMVTLFISCTENKNSEKDKEPMVTTTTITETEEQPDPGSEEGFQREYLLSFTY